MKKLGCKDYLIASLALAFVPVVYVSSTMSVDNVWALCFILIGLYFVLLRQPVSAGVAVGIAIGCRITSGAMLLPMCLLLAKGQTKRAAFRDVFGLSTAAGVVALAAFAPVLAKYGWGFLTFYEPDGYLPWRGVVRRATLEVWGNLGLAGLLVAAVSLTLSPNRFRPLRLYFTPRSDAGVQLLAWVLSIALYVIAYLRLPHQAKYLIPIVPFVILFLGGTLKRRVFVIVCSILIASPFVTIDRAGMQAGPIFWDQMARRREMEFVERVISRANDVHEKAVIIAGAWLPKIQVLSLGRSQDTEKYVYALDESELKRRRSEGSPVYYLADMHTYNVVVTGVDPAEFGAEALFADGPLLADREQGVPCGVDSPDGASWMCRHRRSSAPPGRTRQGGRREPASPNKSRVDTPGVVRYFLGSQPRSPSRQRGTFTLRRRFGTTK